MEGKKVRQRYFIPKELGYSVAFIIISSLAAGVFIIYVAKKLAASLEQETLPILVIMLGYTAIIVVFTRIFSHRLIGPFQRLKMDLKLYRTGNYEKRLYIRNKDDFYIKTFLNEINMLLADCEKIHHSKAALVKEIDFQLREVLHMSKKQECTKEALIDALLNLRGKVESISGKNAS
jgi:hypothetical protein